MPNIKKRIFIGIPVSLETKKKISIWQEKNKKLPVRFIQNKNLHITLLPPWYTEDVKKIEEKLFYFEKIGNFYIKFYKISLGPSFYNPRLIWVEGKTPEKIILLKKNLEKLLNFKAEERKFKTHITIARFSKKDLNFYNIKKIEENINWLENVKSFAIFESLLSKNGAEYKIIKEFKL
jgi:2'-5' RNA ligase